MPETFKGAVYIEDISDRKRIRLSGTDGDIRVIDEVGNVVGHLHKQGGLVLGNSHGQDGAIHLYNSSGQPSVTISGKDGDVILKNADAAEDFDVFDAASILPGTVLVIDDCNRLRPSSSAYDRRVAGVVSGGSTYKPGIVLDRQENSENRLPVALAGKVHVNADASHRPISIGDLLTTSNIPGYAMCVADPARAFGAVIGKALAPLATGRGSVAMLVSLQ